MKKTSFRISSESIQIKKSILIILTASALIFGGFFALNTPQAFAAVSNFNASISPTTERVGETQSYTITITNDAGNGGGEKIKSAKVAVPTSGFSGISGLTLGGGASSDWSVTLNSNVIEMQKTGGGGGADIIPGESFTVIFSVTAGGTPGTYTWTTQSWKNDDFTGSEFDITSSQPSVNVVDLAPVITLVGADPQIITRNSGYVELGATALDDVDGDLTESIFIDALAVDTNVVGSYPVTYDVTDFNGNTAIQVTRTVNVVNDDPVPGDVIINEFIPGAELGWVELLNTTDAPISLDGWTIEDLLTHDESLSSLGTIPAHSIVVFRDRAGIFDNNPDMETITIFDDDGVLIHRVSYGSDPEVDVATPFGGQSAVFAGFSWSVSDSPTKGWFNDAGQPERAPLLSDIDAALFAAGINSNIGELDNPSATPTDEDEGALYFEKEGEGKIVFETTLNLSDQATVAVLQTLGAAMEMSEGHIAFNSETAAAMAATSAKIYMYGLGFASTPNIIVRDDGRNVIGPDDPNYPNLTSIDYNAITGTLTFSASHFTQFDVDDNVYVDDDNNTGTEDGTSANPYNTIQEGIDAADSGDTINVAAGTTYSENLTINEEVTLRGAGRDVVTLTGSHTITADNVVIDGFRLQGISGSNVITVNDATAINGGTISNNYITGGYDGIRLGFNSSGLGVDGITIRDNIITGNAQRGIRFYDAGDYASQHISNITISDNEITSNLKGGISTYGPGPNIITDNTVSGNTGNGISIKYDDGDTVTGNTVTGNTAMGINMHQVTNSTVENNTVSGQVSTAVVSTFWGSDIIAGKGSAIYIHEVSEGNTIRLNDLMDNKIGVLVSREAGSDGSPSNNSINENKITGNTEYGILNALVDPSAPVEDVDAANNWWGASTGPTHASNPGGSGDAVSDNVSFSPWYTDADMTTLSGGATIDLADPTNVSDDFTPQIGSTLARGDAAYLGRETTYIGPAIGGDTNIKWKVTIAGPAALTADMIDLDEVGFKDDPDSEPSIGTYHYPLAVDGGGNLVAIGSCDVAEEDLIEGDILHNDDCIADIGFSLDANDVFTNADKIIFDSSAPVGEYTITYELVDTADDNVLGTYEITIELTSGDELNVCADCTYQTIQSAINAANPSDTINVASGEYAENLEIDKALTLLGDIDDEGEEGEVGPGEDAPIIVSVNVDGEGCLGETPLISIGANDVAVKGFILDGDDSEHNCGFSVVSINQDITGTTISDNEIKNGTIGVDLSANSSENLITNNLIHDNQSGVWMGSSKDNTISDNEIYDNSGMGIELVNGDCDECSSDVSGNKITGNKIDNNNSSGIYVGGDYVTFTDLTISDNEITNNKNYYGIYIDGMRDSAVVIDKNTIDGNKEYGIYFTGEISNSTSTISNNVITDNGSAGIYLDSLVSGVTISGNTIQNNGVVSEDTGIVVLSASGNVAHNNTISGNGDFGVSNQDEGRNVFDAINNWWGDVTGPFHEPDNSLGEGNAVSDNVAFSPWYVNSGRTILSSAVNDEGDAVTATGDEDVSLNSDVSGQADLPEGITSLVLNDDANLDLSAGLADDAVTLQSGVDGEPVVLTNSDLEDVTVSIPDETLITGPDGWDGIIHPPVAGTPSGGNAPAGFSVGSTVISVGSPDGTLVFNKAVTILLEGVTGTVAYRPAGSDTWVEITNVCGGTYANPEDPVSPGECAISNGTDTKIVTYHFTTFGSLNSVPSPTPTPTPSSGGGGGGGSGQSVFGSPAWLSPGVAAAPATGGQVLGVTAFRFTLTLQKGSKGDDVTELQNRLTAEGVYNGPITEYFGSLTEAGVKAYQKKHGIDAVGIVGPVTIAKLNTSLAQTPAGGQVLGVSTSAETEAKITALRTQLVTLITQLLKLLQEQAASL